MDSSKNSFSGAGFDEHHEHGGSHPDENECTTFSYQEWFRLRDFWNSISSLQNMIPISSVQLENCISEEDSYRDYASQIQNLQIRLKILEQKASTAREIILTSRCRINSLEAEIQKSHQEKQQAISRETNQQEEIALGQKQNSEKRIVLQRLHNELIFRRRFMFKELNEIFFPPKPPIFNKNCHCQKFDLIRCLHFPTVAARLGHNDSEISAAAALLVQLINSASLVLSHPLKHVLLFNGSRSLLVIRKNSESFNLFASAFSSKSNRDRFDHALYLLCEVALQFRADCGVSAREMDRPIRLFRDLLRSFTGSHKFVHTEILFRHSKSSYLSPSNYVSIEKEETAKITDKSVDANPLLCNLLPSLQTIY